MPMRALLPWVLVLLAPGLAGAQSAGPILVMPFDRTGGDSHLQWLGEGAAVVIADDLNALGASALTRPERVDAFEQLSLPASAPLSRATVIKVGQLLGASEVIVGSLEVRDAVLTVRARGIELEAGRQRSEVVETGPLGELFGIFGRVSRRLLEVTDSRGRTGTAGIATPPVEAFEQYIKGLVAETPASQARFLERAIELHPAYDAARLALWAVRSEQNDHAGALGAVRGTAAGSPFARGARFDAALSLMELARYDEAFTELTALAAERPAAALDNNLGVVQLRRGDAPQAGLPTYFFTRAADTEPGQPDYAFNLGYAYARQRDMEAARYWLREAVRRNPADADAHFVLGLALDSTGGRVEAARERELARQLSARYEEAEARGRNDTLPRDLERVKRTLETPRGAQVDAAIVGTLQREQDELARFHLDRGRRLAHEQDDRGAIAELRRAIYLSPYLSDAHLLLGRAYVRSGRSRDAIDAFKIAIWSQETVVARLDLARAYLQVEDEAAARAEVERALALDPTSAEAKRVLAEIERRGGREPRGGAS